MKKFTSIILALVFIGCSVFNVDTVYGNTNDNCGILQEQIDVSQQTENDIYTLVLAMNKSNGIETEGIHLGKAITLYNCDEQISVQIYPVLDEDEKCLMFAQVPEKGQISVCEDMKWYDNLKKIINDNGKYILYMNSGVIYAEKESKRIELENTGYVDSKENNFSQYTYQEKVEEINNNANYSLCFINYNNDMYATAEDENIIDGDEDNVDDGELDDDSEQDDDTYGISIDKCNITKFVKQDGYNLCWAATVATIVDYKRNKSLSAEKIADLMKVPYNAGASLTTMVKALGHYKLNYKQKESKISWATIKRRVTVNDRPFGIGLHSSKGNHMITGYGYADNSVSTNSRIVFYWDSNGAKGAFKYYSGVTLYGIQFTWNSTVY